MPHYRGRDVMRMAQERTHSPLVSDGFSINLLSDGLGHDIGALTGGSNRIWTVMTGAWGVSGGRLVCSSVGGATGQIVVDAGSTDYVIEANTHAVGDAFGYVLRYVNSNNYIRAWISFPNVQVQTVVGGVVTTLLSQSISYFDGQKLRFTIAGNKISAWYGGTLSSSGGNGGNVGAEQTITEPILLTSTRVGCISNRIDNAFDNFAVWSIPTWRRIHKPGGVLFTFDDNYTSAMSRAAYAFGKIRGTWYTITNFVGTAGYGTLAELNNMNNSGWLIANHTAAHVQLTTQNLADQTTAIQTARDQLLNWGFGDGAYHLTFPGGVSNADTFTAMTNLGIRTGRSTGTTSNPPAYTTPGRNAISKLVNHITVLMCVSTTTLANIQTVVNRAAGSDSYCMLLIHDIKDTPSGNNEMATSVFNDAVDWVVAQGIDTPTISDFYLWVITGR